MTDGDDKRVIYDIWPNANFLKFHQKVTKAPSVYSIIIIIITNNNYFLEM